MNIYNFSLNKYFGIRFACRIPLSSMSDVSYLIINRITYVPIQIGYIAIRISDKNLMR